MPIVLQAVFTIAFLIVTILALMGAIDFMADSLKIFMEALRRFRERNSRE